MLRSEERKEPYNTLNITNKSWVKTATEKKREERKHSNAKKPYKSGKQDNNKKQNKKKQNTVSKDRQPGERRL